MKTVGELREALAQHGDGRPLVAGIDGDRVFEINGVVESKDKTVLLLTLPQAGDNAGDLANADHGAPEIDQDDSGTAEESSNDENGDIPANDDPADVTADAPEIDTETGDNDRG